jgi:hypothetical protein
MAPSLPVLLSAMPSLPIKKIFTPHHKTPAVLDFYKGKRNIENLSDHCLSPKSFGGSINKV